MGFSVKQTWGSDTGEFFINKYLGASAGPLQIGGVKLQVLIPF